MAFRLCRLPFSCCSRPPRAGSRQSVDVEAAHAAGPADLLVARRDTINLNADWKFYKGDTTGTEAIGYNDPAWANVNLPHVFDTPYYALKKGTFWYVGYGWYRKHFNVQAKWKESSRIFLEFEAAFQVAQVYVNGKLLGEHKGGYTGFYFDITDAVHSGDNVLAVRVNNKWDPQIAPRAGDWLFLGGIHRSVYLVITSPLHVTWYGTFITTPQVSASKQRSMLKPK